MKTKIRLSQRQASVIFSCLIGWAFSFLAIQVFRDYAFGLFIWLPFSLGLVSTLIYSYKNDVPRKVLRNNAYLVLFLVCIGLLLFAWEGLICLIMSAPLGILFTYIGFIIAYYIKKSRLSKRALSLAAITTLSVPALMAFENLNQREEAIRFVTTSIEIDADAEEVWKNVIAFPQLREPDEFLFKTGIAYPISATIEGSGAGAVRQCNFSTGSFVEPITIWEQPKLLQFSVQEQPEPMQELSFYDIHPNHLHGYWVSRKGQFKLIPLPNGHTLLEGTTWYENKIKPNVYWTLWSDYIVHKIHQRVLAHIKVVSERG
ncbi:MAG: hypothetical protein JNL13_07470 [Chitinophagaceae bacterium]|nr:hypothetical protein [Chitinophagaceae bacterium]